jgi:hypothetical protein
MPIWAMGHCRMWSPTPSSKPLPRPAKYPALRRQGSQIGGFYPEPGQRRDDADFSYAGAVTSMVALKQAKYVREDYADGKAYVFYQHMRTPGLSETFTKAFSRTRAFF